MSQKQHLIQAFKSLDFEALHRLLDDNLSYMDVTKNLFLSTLESELKPHINQGLKSYENVVEGVCGFCNKGCKAYKFIAEGFPSLNLFFEETNAKVTDIYLCNALKTDTPIEDDSWDISFSFYEEEKVNFVPSIEYTINIQKVDKAVEDFNSLASSDIVSNQELVYWHIKHKGLASELGLNDFFVSLKYKAFKEIDVLYHKVSNLVHNAAENHLAQEALREYHKIKEFDEKMIAKWLLNHKHKYFFPLEKTENWKKTGFIKLGTEPNLIIDCTECLDSFLFEELYSNLKNGLMAKYEPTKEHLKQNGGKITYSLESFLKLHNKYLDIL